MRSADDAPGVGFETFEAMMTLATVVRTYYDALVAEGFEPAQALALAAAYQTTVLASPDVTPA